MKKLLTLLLMLTGSLASADFTKPDDVPFLSDPPPAGAFAKGRAAALGLSFESVSGNGDSVTNSCSATQISSDGYVLTAMHCLTSCSFIKSGNVKGGTYLAADGIKIRQGKAKCSMTVIYENDSHSRSMTAVAAGVGYVVGDPKAAPAVKALVDQGYGTNQDWVLLKLDKSPAEGCVKANPSLPVSLHIWNLGYPEETDRGHNDAPGGEEVYSSGEVLSVGYYAVSTLDLVPGSSGSGEFNQNGELVAMSRSINIGGSDSAPILKRPIPGSAEAIPIASILRDASSRYGSTVVNQAFNCY